MGVSQVGALSALCAALVLQGCTVADVRGEPAQTREECRQDWLKERQSSQSNAVTTANDNPFESFVNTLLVGFVGFTTAPDVADARYRSCLERLGVIDVDNYTERNQELGQTGPTLDALPPRKPAHCPEYSSVLFGGAGYCVGR